MSGGGEQEGKSRKRSAFLAETQGRIVTHHRFSKEEANSILDVRSEGPFTEESSRSMSVAILNIGLKDEDRNVSF